MKRILLLFLVALSFSSCEKDDICTDETTPRLILEFYDISNPANLKTVRNLKVKAEGAADFIVFNTSLETTNQDRYLLNASKLELPLRIDGNTTKYSLILNSTGTIVAPNEDFLEFNYTSQNIFVSRACGYKTVFTLDNTPNGVVVTDAATLDGLWIQEGNINIQTNSIITENETHIKILF